MVRFVAERTDKDRICFNLLASTCREKHAFGRIESAGERPSSLRADGGELRGERLRQRPASAIQVSSYGLGMVGRAQVGMVGACICHSLAPAIELMRGSRVGVGSRLASALHHT